MKRVWIYVETFLDVDANEYTGIGLEPRININAPLENGNIEMQGVSTSIDSVVKGVRFVDLMRQNAKSIKQDFVLDAPRFDVGSDLYDTFVFNGKLIRGLNTELFTSWKSVSNMFTRV